MPVAVSYPGVYVEEVSSGVRTITGVATSIAAFVDFFPKGPLGDDKNPVGHNAVQVFSFADFERQFGGLDTRSEASYAIQQFFLSGGSSAYVVRVSSATNAAAAAVIDLGDGKTAFLEATAVSAGSWGSDLRVDVDYGVNDPTTAAFNLTVTQTAGAGSTQVVATEKFLNLVNDPTKPNDASATVNAGSQLIKMKSLAAGTPSQSGTASAAITDLSTLALADKSSLTVSLGSSKVAPASIGTTDPIPLPTTIAGLASALQAALRGIKKSNVAVMPGATVTVAGSASSNSYLVVDAGVVPSLNNGKYDSSAFLSFADATGNYQAKLAFAPNVQQYAVGGPNAQGATGGVTGDDGKWDFKADASGIAAAIIGDQAKKSGIYSLLNVDLFNILCLPATMNLTDDAAHAVATDAIALCTDRRAMYILDAPQADKVRDNPTDIMAWLDANAGLRSRNAALYFPRFDIPDPLNKFRNRIVAPSGTMAGLYAATDASRGVWKAPAGTEAGLSGVTKLEYTLTDGENGVLNPLAINALRNFPIYGPVAWGARTLYGADQMADDYKYIPIRRLALYIEESLYRGTQWVVFEPNASPLWAQVRLNVGAFMQNLFKQGAFSGTTPADAYFVTCDATNNPANTINLGIINIAVGFAPIKPAEFVVIQIQQIAGQIAS
jgi:phage tail sheath protein FI